MSTALLLARKDLVQRLRDRSFLILGIIAPFFVAYILSLVAGPVYDYSFSADYVVHDATGFVGEGLVDGLSDAGFGARLAESEAMARALVDDGEASAAILIPSSDLVGDPDPVVVYGSLDNGTAVVVAESIAGSIADRADAVRLLIAETGNPASVGAFLSEEPPVGWVQGDAGDKVLDGITYLSVGMAIFFLYFSVQASIINIVEERANGTLPRLLMAPVGRGSILLGKTLSSAVTGLLSMLVLVVATTLALDADWGPWWGVALLSLAAVVNAMGLGALIGTYARNAEQAGQFAGIVATVLAFLGGVFLPIATGPGPIDALTRISPHRWLLDGFGANAGTGTLADVLIPALVVAGVGVVLGAIAFGRRSRLTGVV